MDCTISPILFVMAMEVILKAAEGSAGPANLGGVCYKPPVKAFMVDTTVICEDTEEKKTDINYDRRSRCPDIQSIGREGGRD